MDLILEHLRGKSGYNNKGEEIPDPKPAALTIDVESEMPLEVKIMRALQTEEWKRMIEKQGLETFQEANDFDVPEEESEFKSFHEDEAGDIMAFEEGVKRGFIEEIPEQKREEVRKQTDAVKKYMEARNTTNRSSQRTETPDRTGVSETNGVVK